MMYDTISLIVGTCLDGRVVGAPDYGPQGSGFKSCWRQNSVIDCMVLHCTEPIVWL